MDGTPGIEYSFEETRSLLCDGWLVQDTPWHWWGGQRPVFRCGCQVFCKTLCLPLQTSLSTNTETVPSARIWFVFVLVLLQESQVVFLFDSPKECRFLVVQHTRPETADVTPPLLRFHHNSTTDNRPNVAEMQGDTDKYPALMHFVWGFKIPRGLLPLLGHGFARWRAQLVRRLRGRSRYII